MKVKFVVFRVRDELQAALLLESVRFGPTRLDGKEMSAKELRAAALAEIDASGEWRPPPVEKSGEPA